jgi:hypothetical protein
MLYLIWGLINIALFLFFIFICFQAIILVKDKLGIFAALLFVFGTLSFVGFSNNDNQSHEPYANRIKHWDFTPQDSIVQNTMNYIHIDIEKTLISKYNLGIQYGQEKSSKLNAPITASSATEGLVSGTYWRPISIIVNQTKDNKKFEYTVLGKIEWKLLGATVYSQSKIFKGFALTK